MKFHSSQICSFYCSITIGAQYGYTNQSYSKEELTQVIQTFQRKLIKESSVYLSVSLSECEIILDGQVELHYKIEIINYPKFPKSNQQLSSLAELLARHLAETFSQNRVVIYHPEKTLMIEKDNNQIDPRIS